MDLSDYLQILRRRWPFALIGLVLTAGLTVLFVNNRPPVYESKGTYVIRPQTADPGDGLRAIDTLTRGVEISTTFATVARSDLVRERAEQRLAADIDTSGMTVSSEVLTSTNVLEVKVTGGDAEATHTLAKAVGDETIAYVTGLQQVFGLRVLDAPRVPDKPAAPNQRLIVATGIVFGVGVGMLFALLAEGLARAPKVRARDSDSHGDDDIDTTEEDGTQTPQSSDEDESDVVAELWAAASRPTDTLSAARRADTIWAERSDE